MRERRLLVGLGVAAAAALSVRIWQQQRPTVTLVESPPISEVLAWDGSLAAARTVDLNTASVSELERLPGLGPELARRIVIYRQDHGRFSETDELSHVRGVGPKTLEMLRAYIRIE